MKSRLLGLAALFAAILTGVSAAPSGQVINNGILQGTTTIPAFTTPGILLNNNQGVVGTATNIGGPNATLMGILGSGWSNSSSLFLRADGTWAPGGIITTSGTITPGYTAQWATVSSLAAVANTGTGSYVLQTSPAIQGTATFVNLSGSGTISQFETSTFYNMVGQDSSHNLSIGWNYNATPSLGYAEITTYGQANNLYLLANAFRFDTASLAFAVQVFADGNARFGGGNDDTVNNLQVGGTFSATGQIKSTVTTGTAPFVVSSTTNVANLNSSTLGGFTFSAPGQIGSVTPNTGAFTTLAASSTVSGTGFSTYLASPPAIGGSSPNAGTFTTLSATSLGLGLASPYFTLSLQSTSQNVLESIGQDSTHLLYLEWNYSGTTSAASAGIGTYGQSNPLTIAASSLALSSTGLASALTIATGGDVTVGGGADTGSALGVNGTFTATGASFLQGTVTFSKNWTQIISGVNVLDEVGQDSTHSLYLEWNYSGTSSAASAAIGTYNGSNPLTFSATNFAFTTTATASQFSIGANGDTWAGGGSDPGAPFGVNGNATITGTVSLGGGGAFKITAVNSVSPSAQNRTFTISYGGTTYYLTGKTTDD